MFILLKFIHILCIFVAGGASIGNAVLGKKVKASGAPPTPLVGDSMFVLGRMGLAAVIVLWLTGVPMLLIKYGTFAEGLTFYIKLIVASTLFVSVAMMNLEVANARKEKRPPNEGKMHMLDNLAKVSGIGAMLFAVITFN